MNQETQGQDQTTRSHVTATFFWIFAVIAAVLLGCAFALCYRLTQIQDSTDPYVEVALIQTMLLCCGFGIGLFGSGWALTAHESQQRYGTATTVLGCAFLSLGFVIRPILESRLAGAGPHWSLLLVPGAFFGCAFGMFARAAQAGRLKPTGQPAEESIQEPQQPQSQP